MAEYTPALRFRFGTVKDTEPEYVLLPAGQVMEEDVRLYVLPPTVRDKETERVLLELGATFALRLNDTVTLVPGDHDVVERLRLVKEMLDGHVTVVVVVVLVVVVVVVVVVVGLVVGEVLVVVVVVVDVEVVVVVVVLGHDVMQGQQQYSPVPHEPHITPYPHSDLVSEEHSCSVTQTQPLGQDTILPKKLD